MFRLIAAYEERGLNRQSFCEAEGIKLATFSYWRTKYLKSLSSSQSAEPGFVSLVPAHLAPVSGLELHYGGVKLCFSSEVPMDYVVGMVRKLSESC